MQKKKLPKPRVLQFATALVLFFALCAPAAHAAPTPEVYVDRASGAQFTPPENWEVRYDSREDGGEGVSGRYVAFAPVNSDSVVFFAIADIFGLLEDTGMGQSRETLDMDYFSSEQGATLLRYYTSGEGEEPPMPIEKHYGRYDFLRCETTTYDEELGIDLPYLQLLHLSEGQLYDFTYIGEIGGDDYNDYLRMVTSFKLGADVGGQVPTGAAGSITQSLSAGLEGGGLLDDFFGLMAQNEVLFWVVVVVLTVVLNTVPMLIYRYGVKKAPLPQKRAAVIAFVYTAALQLVIGLLPLWFHGPFDISIFGVALWGGINTAILASGKRSAKLEDEMTGRSKPQESAMDKVSKTAEHLGERFNHKSADLLNKTRKLFDDSELLGDRQNQAANTVHRDGKFDNRYDDDGYAFQIQESKAPAHAAARPSGDAHVDADGYTHFDNQNEVCESPVAADSDTLDPYGRYQTSSERRDYYRSAPTAESGGSSYPRGDDRYDGYNAGDYGKSSGDEECRYCGKMMNRDARVCQHCGARFL